MCKRQRKVFYIVVLGLTLILSVFPAFSSFAYELTGYDASDVLVNDVPEAGAAWVSFFNSENPSGIFGSSSDNSVTLAGPNSYYTWRSNVNFRTLTPSYSDPIFLMGYKYGRYDFTVDRVYEITVDFRTRVQYNSDVSPDYTKLLLSFSKWSWSTSATKVLTQEFYPGFAPSSVEVVTLSGDIPTRVRLKYTISIYPLSNFGSQTVNTSGNFQYISFDALYFLDMGAFVVGDNRTVNWQETDTDYYQWNQNVEMYGINVTVFTQDQYHDMVIQGAADQISQSIDNAASAINNAGQPIDFSDLEEAHQAEHDLAQRITSTIAYTPSMGSNMVNLLRSGTLENGISYVNDWLDYFYENNVLVWYLFYSTLATVCIYMVFRGVF